MVSDKKGFSGKDAANEFDLWLSTLFGPEPTSKQTAASQRAEKGFRQLLKALTTSEPDTIDRKHSSVVKLVPVLADVPGATHQAETLLKKVTDPVVRSNIKGTGGLELTELPQENIAKDTTTEDKKATHKGTSTVKDVRGTKTVTPPKRETNIAKNTTMKDKKAAQKSEMQRYGAQEQERIRKKAEEENIGEADAEQNLRKGGPTKKVYGMRHGGFTKRGPMS